LIVAVAAGLRFWRLDAIPPGFHFDEAYEALEAWRVVTQPGYHPIFFPGNFGVEPMFIYLTSLAFRLFGETPAVMRGVAAAVGTATVLAVVGLGRELALNDRRFPITAAWLAALALAVMRWHLIFSRVGIEPILAPLFLTLILWAFWRAWRTGSTVAWAAAGLATGLGLYIYPAARLLPILFAMLSLLAFAFARRRVEKPAADVPLRPPAPRWARGLIVAWLAAGLIALPMAWNWLRHPDQLLLRSSQIAVGPSGAAPGSPAQNLLASLGMFSVQGDRDPRSNVPSMPAFDLLISVPFMIGAGLAAWRWKRPVFASLLLAGLLMLMPTVFSEDAPHFRRAVGETPVAALLIGLGLAAILGWRGDAALRQAQDATRSLSLSKRRQAQDAYVPWQLRESGWDPTVLAQRMDRLAGWGRGLVVAAILTGSAIYSATAYFDIWGRSNALFYAYDQGLWEIGHYVLDLPAGTPVYLSPRPESDMTLAFAWRDGPDVRRFDGRHAFVAPPAGRPAVYIIIDYEDYRGARLLRDLYPGATEVKTFRDRNGGLYARAFRVENPAQLARQPQVTLAARWPGISLIGYDIDRTSFAPGTKIFLHLWWRADASSLDDWTVFTHVLGPARTDGSAVWAGLDAAPGQGSAPTHAWAAGDLILDEYQIPLPADMPPGDYQIEVGLYRPQADGRRLELLQPAGQDHLIVGTVQVR
jgi:4-amino-4-deoxy-L-arabinose transferase-like glycosyltransferase